MWAFPSATCFTRTSLSDETRPALDKTLLRASLAHAHEAETMHQSLALPVLLSAWVESLPNRKSFPSFVTKALVPALQQPFTTDLPSMHFISFGF